MPPMPVLASQVYIFFRSSMSPALTQKVSTFNMYQYFCWLWQNQWSSRNFCYHSFWFCANPNFVINLNLIILEIHTAPFRCPMTFCLVQPNIDGCLGVIINVIIDVIIIITMIILDNIHPIPLSDDILFGRVQSLNRCSPISKVCSTVVHHTLGVFDQRQRQRQSQIQIQRHF